MDGTGQWARLFKRPLDYNITLPQRFSPLHTLNRWTWISMGLPFQGTNEELHISHRQQHITPNLIPTIEIHEMTQMGNRQMCLSQKSLGRSIAPFGCSSIACGIYWRVRTHFLNTFVNCCFKELLQKLFVGQHGNHSIVRKSRWPALSSSNVRSVHECVCVLHILWHAAWEHRSTQGMDLPDLTMSWNSALSSQ